MGWKGVWIQETKNAGKEGDSESLENEGCRAIEVLMPMASLQCMDWGHPLPCAGEWIQRPHPMEDEAMSLLNHDTIARAQALCLAYRVQPYNVPPTACWAGYLHLLQLGMLHWDLEDFCLLGSGGRWRQIWERDLSQGSHLLCVRPCAGCSHTFCCV